MSGDTVVVELGGDQQDDGQSEEQQRSPSWKSGGKSLATALSKSEVNDDPIEDVPAEAEETVTSKGRVHNVLKGIFRSLTSKFKKWRLRQNEVYSGGHRPTTQLIFLVIGMSFVMALAVAGTAAGLQWAAISEARQTALLAELGLTANAVSAFVGVDRAAILQQSTAAIVASTIREIGYKASLETMIKTQQRSVSAMAMLTDFLYNQNAAEKVDLASSVLALTVESLCQLGHCDLVPAVFERVNTRLRQGHNILIGKLTTNSSVEVLSDRWGCRGDSSCLTEGQQTMMAKTLFQRASGNTSIVGQIFGYQYVPSISYGIVYSAENVDLVQTFYGGVIGAINNVNLDFNDGSIEILMESTKRPGYQLTDYKYSTDCRGPCGYDPTAAALVGGDLPYIIGKDYRGNVDVAATSKFIPNLNATILMKTDVTEIVDGIIYELSRATTTISAMLIGSQKLLIAKRMISDGGKSYAFIDAEQRLQNCSGHCRQDDAMMNIATNCDAGRGTMMDYRGVQVIAGYACISDLNIGVALELDLKEIVYDSVAQVVEFANGQNKNESSSVELMISQHNGDGSINVITDPKDKTDMVKFRQWTKAFRPAYEALQGKKTFYVAKDYRDTSVLAATDYSPTLNVGFVLKVDQVDFEMPIVLQIIKLLGAAIGIAVGGVFFIGFFSRRMMNQIEATWEKGKQEVLQQKENFEHLVGALYPNFATEMLLAGEAQIVQQVDEATVFFSDICNFTLLSNKLTASAMMDWIGYIFSVMDNVAEFYQIYKVKTVGDAYFAVAGPSSLIEGTANDGHTLRMLRFASDCVQVFSGNYAHPDVVQSLKEIAKQSALMKRQTKAHTSRAHSNAPSSTISGNSSSTGMTGSDVGNANRFQCAMRYGISMGPITMGVLQGKRPIFDVWGKTVNMAARMENTGQPGCIHLSELAYQTVMKEPDNEFSFDPVHTVYAKGFGNVSAYFVKAAQNPPPRPLLNTLQLETSVGCFIFASQTYQRSKNHPTSEKKRAFLAPSPALGSPEGSMDKVTTETASKEDLMDDATSEISGENGVSRQSSKAKVTFSQQQ